MSQRQQGLAHGPLLPGPFFRCGQAQPA